MTNSPLVNKKCQPCEGTGKPLSKEKAQEYLNDVEQWVISDDSKWITRDFVMKNFMAAVEMIKKIADVAEAENHHPDIHLTGYKKLRVTLSTHAIGGLSENDFIMATKINHIDN